MKRCHVTGYISGRWASGVVLVCIIAMTILVSVRAEDQVDKAVSDTDAKREMKMPFIWEQTEGVELSEGKATIGTGGVKSKLDQKRERALRLKEKERYLLTQVTIPAEQKFDKNNNGWLEPRESRNFLKERYARICAEGYLAAATDLEKRYDTNGDGVIDMDEAKQLKNDLK